MQHGYKVRNIINTEHRIATELLSLFFVDLETNTKNNKVQKIRGLENKIIEVEHPRTNKNKITQCIRCQQYGHSKLYCNLFALNVEEPTIVQKHLRKPQQSVHCVVETTP